MEASAVDKAVDISAVALVQALAVDILAAAQEPALVQAADTLAAASEQALVQVLAADIPAAALV